MLANGSLQQLLERADLVVEVGWPCIQGLLAGKGQQTIGHRCGAAGRIQRGVGKAQDRIGAAFVHAFLQQLDAGDDPGQQIIEIMCDAAGQLAQRVHFLRLHQLPFGPDALGNFSGQLVGGVVELLPL